MTFKTWKNAKDWAKSNLKGLHYRLITSYVNAERGHETKIIYQSRPFGPMNE
jgi:hypothetical protein